MNAVLIRAADAQDRYPVKYAGGNRMNENLSELPAAVRNLQIHVTDIKAEVRATNAKIDSLSDRVEQYRDERNQKIDSLREWIELHREEDNKKIDTRFDKVDARFEKVEQNRVEDNRKIDTRFDKIDARFEKVEQNRIEDNRKIEARFDKIDAKFEKVEQNRIEDNRRIDDRFEEARKETKAEFAAVRAEMQAEFKDVREEIAKSQKHNESKFDLLQGQITGLAKDLSKAQIWAYGLYFVGMGILLSGMAKGFKWI